MAKTLDQDSKALEDQLDKLQVALESANENGLLNNDPAKYQAILNHITDALTKLNQNPPDIIGARKEFSSAYFEFNHAINSSSAWWRFKYSFGGPFILYFVASLAFVFLAWLFFGPSLSSSKLLWIPAWAFLWGLVGGVLQGLWFLWQHVSDRKVRKAWIPWYLLLPLMGAILGALTYLAFVAGFIAVTGGAQVQSDYFGMLLSGLAGFGTRWAVQTLDKITSLIQIGK